MELASLIVLCISQECHPTINDLGSTKSPLFLDGGYGLQLLLFPFVLLFQKEAARIESLRGL